MFAGLTGDFHPQHADAEWAAASPFGERIAHGLLVLSLAAGLVDFDPEEVLALRRVRDVVFKRPVKLGDTIRVERREGRAGADGHRRRDAAHHRRGPAGRPSGARRRASPGSREPAFEPMCVPL